MKRKKYRRNPYSGWKNWQTWNVALWAGNDEGVYRYIREQKKYVKRYNRDSAKAITFEVWPHGTPDMRGRGGAAAFRGVDWSAISRAFNEF